MEAIVLLLLLLISPLHVQALQAAGAAQAPAPAQEAAAMTAAAPSPYVALPNSSASWQQNLTFCVANWEPIAMCNNATDMRPGEQKWVGG